MLHVGLTGGIASGKSTVARMFEQKGAFLIDLDELAHFVEEPDRPGWKAIVEYFGEDILNADRTINRENLGAIVFHDRRKLEKLNDLVHPFVFEEWKGKVATIANTKTDAIVMSDVPLLYEAGLEKCFDAVILVYSSPEDQIRRLMQRNGLTQEAALTRLASQMSIHEKLSRADYVIDNRGPIQETGSAVDAVWESLTLKERKRTEGTGT
jgi:dephospho-CoA kinase